MMPKITVITPTTGKDSLFNLVESVKSQKLNIEHLLLWDDFREGQFTKSEDKNIDFINPLDLQSQNLSDNGECVEIKSIVINGNMVQGEAKGSALRAIGLMAATGDFVTFADDDVIWEQNHLQSMLKAISDKQWAFCKRRIWAQLPDGNFEFLGIDDFESVGEDAKTPYKMVDNNCMMFTRRLGTSAAVLYRETKEYNDDRLMYNFLKTYGGDPGKTIEATINQVCPERLINFFRLNCTK